MGSLNDRTSPHPQPPRGLAEGAAVPACLLPDPHAVASFALTVTTSISPHCPHGETEAQRHRATCPPHTQLESGRSGAESQVCLLRPGPGRHRSPQDGCQPVARPQGSPVHGAGLCQASGRQEGSWGSPGLGSSVTHKGTAHQCSESPPMAPGGRRGGQTESVRATPGSRCRQVTWLGRRWASIWPEWPLALQAVEARQPGPSWLGARNPELPPPRPHTQSLLADKYSQERGKGGV